MSLLANVDSATFWAHHSWTDFVSFPQREKTVVVLPVHGFNRYIELPLDTEELVTSVVLRAAVKAVKDALPILVMPPLRFALGTKKSSALRVDAELAYTLLHEIAASVQAAGFSKLVFFNSSAANVNLIDAASRDIRAGQNLQTFVINTGGVGLSFSEEAKIAPWVDLILSDAPADFETARIELTDAAAKLASLFSEIDARGPLGEKNGRSPVEPAKDIVLECMEVFPRVYRDQYLPSFSADDLVNRPNKERTLVILPTGAIEQHGHHLAVGVDALLGQAALIATLPLLTPDLPVLVAPPVTYGKSNEHLGFPGTVYISATSLRRLLLAIATELHALGFRRIGIYNTHGGNIAVVNYTLQEIAETLNIEIFILRSEYRPPLSEQEMQYGFHAGEWETSLMLAATPDLVRMDRATCEFPAHIDDPGFLRPECAPAIFSWITRDLSVSGVMGDATVATLEKGKSWLAGMAASLAKVITRIATESTH